MQMCSLRLQFADLFHDLPLAHKITVNQTGAFYFSQACPEDALSANPFLWRPLIFHMPCLVRLSLMIFLNGTIGSAISFWTLWTIFWLAKTSNKPQPNDLAGGWPLSCNLVLRMSTIFSRSKLMIPIVLSQSFWMFYVWLVFTSNLNSQTTWLKVKL